MELPKIQRKTYYPTIEKVQKENDTKAKPDDKKPPPVKTGRADSQAKWIHESLGRVPPLCLCQEHIYSNWSQDLGDVVEVGKKKTFEKATPMDKEVLLAHQREQTVDIQDQEDNPFPNGGYAYRPN